MREPVEPGPSVRIPGLVQSLTPVVVLALLLALSIWLFGADSSQGANQLALTLAAAVAAVIAIANGERWSDIQDAIVRGISTAMSAILILLAIGALIGTWSMAGTVPAMIYYGVQLLSPTVFYPTACLICALVSVAIGSSWTTAGTIGIGLMGVAQGLGLAPEITAGAVISGAYFGDKMSPLSDTTNLAPAMAGTDLFTHIRHMTWTTVPSIGLAVVLFAVIGATAAVPADTAAVADIRAALDSQFVIGPHLLVPVVIVLGLVIARMPAFPALLIGALIGGLFAVLFQQAAVLTYVGDAGLPRSVALLQGAWMALFAGYSLDSGHTALDDLLSRGGMAGMLTTVWLILSAMMFGAVMETTGMLQRIAGTILGAVRGTGSLIAATLATAFGMNVIASDQYIAIVLPGRMFRAEYRRRGLHPKNLSRSLEDAGTLTSVLVPWNTCGAFMAQTLGVATFTYAPFAFFNLINPLVALAYGLTGFTIAPATDAEQDEAHVA